MIIFGGNLVPISVKKKESKVLTNRIFFCGGKRKKSNLEESSGGDRRSCKQD